MNAEICLTSGLGQNHVNECLNMFERLERVDFEKRLACLYHMTYNCWASNFSKLGSTLFRMNVVQLEKILRITPDPIYQSKSADLNSIQSTISSSFRLSASLLQMWQCGWSRGRDWGLDDGDSAEEIGILTCRTSPIFQIISRLLRSRNRSSRNPDRFLLNFNFLVSSSVD